MRGTTTWISAAVVTAALAVAGTGVADANGQSAAAAGGATPEARVSMRHILATLSDLLPLALDDKVFSAPERRDFIRSHLTVLEDSAEAVRRHGDRRDPSFSYLAGVLVDDTAMIQRAFEAGRTGEARLALRRLTDACTTCHSRLPGRDSDLAARLVERATADELSLRERARLFAATRQVDQALSTYEALFADATVEPDQLDWNGDLAEYLTLALRVEGNLRRARSTMARLLERKDLRGYLRGYVETWADSLERLDTEGLEPATLERARDFVARGQDLRAQPASRAGLVWDLAASALLYRLVDAAHDPGPQLAEEMYLLAVTDAWTRRSDWLEETRFYLENSIRMAPRAEFASQAFDLYEEYTLFAYAGSGGLHLPADEEARLDALRKLVTGP
jgi:hypothetical protein